MWSNFLVQVTTRAAEFWTAEASSADCHLVHYYYILFSDTINCKFNERLPLWQLNALFVFTCCVFLGNKYLRDD